MPQEVWGFKVGDYVEVRESFDGRWEPGRVVALTAGRTLQVRMSDGPLREVRLPKHARPWKQPQTAEEIERYLDG